jgi:nucleoside-diphosphate-sugar epimerase
MILITGINGFIAKNLYNTLINNIKLNKDDIIGTTKEESTNITEILNEKKPETIYHIGSEIYNNDKMFESNILLTYKILEYCRTAKNLKRLIIFGSSSEYGRKNKPISEEDNLEPDTIYEGTKSACTMLARSYSFTYKIPIIIIRPFTIYGPNEKENKFMQIIMKKIINNDKTISVSKGVHDYVYIDDFVNALIEIVNNNNNIFDIINIGSGIQTSNKEIIDIFEKTFDYKFDTYLNLESKVYDTECWVCNNNKLNKYYKNRISIEKGIKILYNKYKNNN